MTTAQHLPAFRPPPALPDFLGGAILTGLVHDGEALVLAREVGEALGYHSAGKGFVDAITRSWSTEMQEGKHYRVLKPADEVLVIGGGVESTPLNNRGSMCLTEKGVWRAIMLGRTEPCIKARDWVEDDLLPWYREQRRLHAAGVPTARPGATPRPSTPLDLTRRRLTLREAREARLRRAQEMKAMKAARAMGVATAEQERAMLRRHLREFAREQGPVPASSRTALPPGTLEDPCIVERLAIEGPVDEPPAPLLEISRRWKTPMELTEALRMPGTFNERKRRIGIAITAVGEEQFGGPDGLRQHPMWTHGYEANRRAGESIQVNDEGLAKTAPGRLYNPRPVLSLLRDWMRRERSHWLPRQPANLSAAPVDPEAPAA